MADVDIQHNQLIAQTDGMLANWFQWTDCKQGENLMNTRKTMQTMKDRGKPPGHDNRKQAFQRTHASSSVVVEGSIHREHKHKDQRGDRSRSYNRTVLAKSAPRIVSRDAETRQRLRNELKTTNVLGQRTQRIHGSTRIRTASIARRGYEVLGLQKQNEPRDRDNFPGNFPTKQPGASQGSNRLGQSKLQERLNALKEYFSKNMPPVLLSPHSPTDMSEVNAFHAILENFTDEEWEVFLRVVMQPDDLIQEQLVSKVVSDSPSSKPVVDIQPPLTEQFVSATKRQKTSTFPQSNPRTVVKVSGSLPTGTKSRICINSGLSSGDACHINRIRLREVL
ncbi:uncharacterized protein DEA37_0002734 [Paragonimus westermani]|uniref:Uncharacterized protein n=1 Tax=Paragonimus westermani TaxID=34504 RepID=A0A5J4NS34_9TREM|nr:uncharacterized protein DEA37_0002734 [Paragonimus westermani]